jgi:hypothetical protein
MTQPQGAVDQSTLSSASPTLRLDEEGVARALALSEPRQVPPAEVPGYRIERCLGVGAYGSVWLASELNTGKQVAIKFYSHRRGLDWSLLNREVEKLAELYTSREVIGLMRVGWDADPPYYVMEFLKNGSLARLLERGSLPVSEAVRIATAVATALVHAHKHGILHCDVKPANVLLDGEFAPRLADFGQARLSHEQSPALGTLFYMAPEQADLAAVPDPRWDVYALGAMLYHMLCGEPPFRTVENERLINSRSSLEEKLATYRLIVETSPRPNAHRNLRAVDTRLADIVDRCLAADPARRFANVAAVAEALEARSRYRSLRPAIALGIILPGLLILALIPLALVAVASAVGTSEKNIAARALESDAVTAKILAYSINDDLVQRTRTLEQYADEPELIARMSGATKPAGSPQRRELAELLAGYKHEIDKIRSEQKADPDDSWFLTDARGFQRWREPASPATLDRNFGWRDYFHARGDDHPEWRERTDISPLRSPHISAPFRSTTTGRLKVAISVPVWDANKQEILGVLSRSIHLGELLSSYKRLIREEEQQQEVRRVIALLDVRTGKVLDHPWMTEENRERLRDNAVFERLAMLDSERRELEQLKALVDAGIEVKNEHLDAKYFDPIRKIDAAADEEYGMAWLAAFWPVGDTGWFAVVQEPRGAALRPVREIQAGLVRYSLAGLILCVILIVTSWYFVRRVMRERPFRLGRRDAATP